MKVKLKVKHLLMTLGVVLLFIPLMSFVIGPQLTTYFAEKKALNGSDEAKQELLAVLENNLNNSKKWSIIEEHMIDGPLSRRFDIYVGPSFTLENHYDRIPFTIEEKTSFLKEYVEEGPVQENLVHAATQLATYYENVGQLDQADQVLTRAIERFSSSQYSYHEEELVIERIDLAIRNQEWEQADIYIQTAMQHIDQQNFQYEGELARMQAEYLLQQGNMEEAYEKIEAAIQELEKDVKELNKPTDTDQIVEKEQLVIHSELNYLKKYLNKLKESNGETITVTGKVIRNDGTPMESVGVFLREEANVNQSVMEEERHQVLTDQNGNFTFEDVVPGNYQINLGFTYDQIDGWTAPLLVNNWLEIQGEEEMVTFDVTLYPLMDLQSPVNQETITDEIVHFAWEEVDGAAYYSLNLALNVPNGSVSTVFKQKVEETEIEVPIEDIYDARTGMSFENEKWTSVVPETLLGFTNSENKFSWSVVAYQENGEMITRSNGYRLTEQTIGNLPTFYLKERELTAADQLLLDKKIEEALAAYERSYEQNSNDKHSLRMLFRLMGASQWREEDPDSKSIEYMEKLAKMSHYPDYYYELAMHYYEKREWNQYNKWMEDYERVGGEMSDYLLGIHGHALMMQGELAEAKKYLTQSVNLDTNHRFVGYLLTLYIYENDIDKALQIAKDYPEHGYEHENWLPLIHHLSEEMVQHDDYEQEIKKVLDYYFLKEEEALNNWKDLTEYTNLRNFIVAVQSID